MYTDVTETPVFSSIEDLDRNFILPLFIFRTLTKGQVLFYQNEPANSLCIVAFGELVKSFEAETRSLVLSHHGPGDLIGEAEVMHNRRVRYVNTTAAADTGIWQIERTRLETLLARYPSLYQEMFNAIGERFLRAGKKITYLAFLDARMRVIQLLIDHFRSHQPSTSSNDWRITQQEIGDLVGLNRESVARALSDLVEHGVVQLGRGRIVVSSLQKLRKLAHLIPATTYDD